MDAEFAAVSGAAAISALIGHSLAARPILRMRGGVRPWAQRAIPCWRRAAMKGVGLRGLLRGALLPPLFLLGWPLSGQVDTVVAEPGSAGYPQFEAVAGGVRAFWSPGARATAYRTTGYRIAPETVVTNERLLPATFRGLFCTLSTNSAGDAPESHCNSYRPDAAPDPVPDPGDGIPTPSTGEGVFYEKVWPSTLAVGDDVVWISGSTNSIQSGTLIDGTSGRFLRSASDGEWEYSHGVDLVMPNADATRPREIWIDTSIRFTGSGWATSVDDKTLFVMLNTQAYEWRTFLRGGGFYGGPYWTRPEGSIGDWLTAWPASPSDLFNGQWHRFRVHQKMGADANATDGVYQVWIDNTLAADFRGIRTLNPPSEYFKYLVLGRNSYVSNGAAREWGSVRVYTSNPGW